MVSLDSTTACPRKPGASHEIIDPATAVFILKQRHDLNIIPYITNGRELSLTNRIGELEVELENRRWVFPSIGCVPRDRETDRLVRDMRFYSRSDHVPDRIVATMLASWGMARREQKRIEYGHIDLQSR